MGWSSQLFAGVSLPPYLQQSSEKGRVSRRGDFPAVLWVCWLCDLHNPEALVARAGCNGLCRIWGRGLQVWPRGPGGEGGEGGSYSHGCGGQVLLPQPGLSSECQGVAAASTAGLLAMSGVLTGEGMVPPLCGDSRAPVSTALALPSPGFLEGWS